MGRDPFQFRRIEAGLGGGGVYLYALFRAALPVSATRLADLGLGSTCLLLLIGGHLPEARVSAATAAWFSASRWRSLFSARSSTTRRRRSGRRCSTRCCCWPGNSGASGRGFLREVGLILLTLAPANLLALAAWRLPELRWESSFLSWLAGLSSLLLCLAQLKYTVFGYRYGHMGVATILLFSLVVFAQAPWPLGSGAFRSRAPVWRGAVLVSAVLTLGAMNHRDFPWGQVVSGRFFCERNCPGRPLGQRGGGEERRRGVEARAGCGSSRGTTARGRELALAA